MATRQIDKTILEEFEEGLDTVDPGKSRIPMRILGYGEISTVFEIIHPSLEGLAFKRLPIFNDRNKAEEYIELHNKYNKLLRECGLQTPGYGAEIVEREDGIVVLYIYQEKLPPNSIGNKAIHILSQKESIKLFKEILEHLSSIFRFNQEMKGDVAIGIDGQISNWGIIGYSGGPTLPSRFKLTYLDTTTPLIRINGVEQIDAEQFLKATPPLLRWILKKMYLQEILDRYYDFRSVVLDLIANLYKEKKPELIPDMVEAANQFFKDMGYTDIETLSEQEVKKYYDSDARIWSIYLTTRKIHRFIKTKILRKYYEFILPEKIER